MPYTKYTVEPKVTVIHRTHCCGIMEIDYLGRSTTPLEALKAIALSLMKGADNQDDNDHYAPRFVTFSGVVGTVAFSGSHDGGRKDDYGQKFADYLVGNGLGTVIATEPQRNWTRNYIKLWIWTPNYDTLWVHLGLPQYRGEREK